MEKATLKLLLHYYFEDEQKHSMDAFVRNENERDVLAIIRQTVELLDREVKIEIIATSEGGLIDKYIVKGKTLEVLTVLLLSVGTYFQWQSNQSQARVSESQIRVNASQERLNNLQIEALEEENAKQKRELRKQLQTLESDSLKPRVVKDLIDSISGKVVDTLAKDYKAIWHRSKFFDRSYKTTNKIDKVSTQIFDEKDKPVDKERTANRNDFKQFVLKTNNVQSLVDKNAIIEIISPVLNATRFTWKGLYNSEVITFHMLDKLFIQKIQNKEVEFTNGTTIRCVLEQKRKIDDTTGLIRVVKNNVLSVAPLDDRDRNLVVPRKRTRSIGTNTQLQLGLQPRNRDKR